MNRLTKKDIEGAYDFTYSNGEFVRGICPLGEHPNQEIYSNGLNKLGKLEDIEQDLECPLDVVFKALMNGIYIKDLPKGYEHRKVILNYLVNDNSFIFRPSAPYGSCKLYLKDYKKTWFLKEDRSE